MSLSPAPRDAPGLLRALMASDPGRPRITWYGTDGERVELSARVLDNWVAKTANLLAEELDAGPGSSVRLDLPMHWRTAVWALAAWSVGARLVSGADADVVVTTDAAGRPPGGGRIVAVALPALAQSVPGLAPDVLDYNAEVSGYGDELLVADGPAPLPAPARLTDGVRLLLTGPDWTPETDLVAPLLADGSVVLCHPRVAADRVAVDRIREEERVTAGA